MKNKIFTSITLAIIFLFFYLLFGIWGVFQIIKNDKILFNSRDKLNFHRKYSEKIHHLRDVNSWSKKNEYLFSIVGYDKDYFNTVLLQGDSWIESISKIPDSEKLLQEFSKKRNLIYIMLVLHLLLQVSCIFNTKYLKMNLILNQIF